MKFLLTYLRSGNVKHLDSEGYTDIISNQRMMMMNAGARYEQEERVLKEGGILEGLQIFIRPETSNLPPQVQFHQLPEIYSNNEWRKIAGKGDDYPLKIRSNIWIMDLRLEKGKEIVLPNVPTENCTFLFYVFDGHINVKETVTLVSVESVLIEAESPKFIAVETSDVVLFITVTDTAYFSGGMYSGNLHNRQASIKMRTVI